MKVVYILLGCLINHLNSKCNELKNQPQITCHSFTYRCCILEGDEEEFYKLRKINTQIVEKSFQIPYQEEPILIRVVNSLNQNKINKRLMCSLFVNLEYYITCMGLDLISYEEQVDYSEQIRIDTKILANEFCDELFTNEDESLTLFCIGQSTIKQYSLDLQKKNVNLSLEHDVSDQIEDECKKKQFKRQDDHYLIVFYQCSRWKVLLIKNNQANTLFDAQMKYQNIQLSRLSFIDDVVYCDLNYFTSSIYLIENNFYVYVHFDQDETQNLNYLLVQYANRIQKILIQQKCSFSILLNELDESDSSPIQPQKTLEILLNQHYSMNNIHFHQNLVFLQNQFELDVLINVRINQTYQICNTSLYFFDFDNLFCQYDQAKKVLQFYKYKPLSAVIKPKQKYIYVIQKNNLFRKDDLIYCFRILYENNTQKEIPQSTELMIFQNNCQNKQYQIWKSQYPNQFKNSTYNLYSSDGNLKVSIKKYQDFQHNCFLRLSKFFFQDKFYLKEKINGYICFQYESFFYIYDCKQQQLIISVNIDQYYVLKSDLAYYFVNKNNNNALRGVLFLEDSLQHFNIKLTEVITSFNQIYQSIFLYTNSSNLPLIIYMNSKPYQSYKYLSKTLYQPEPILFYFEFGNSKFIQYSSILALQNKENLRCYKLQELQIISIRAQSVADCYSMVAIHNQTRSLILNYFIDQELLYICNYTFQDYSFYYPVKYSIITDNLAILIEQNNLLYIAIFSFNQSLLSLDEIIQTDDSFFKFDSDLLFFSSDKVWKYSFLKQFRVELELEKFHQYAISQNFSLNQKEEGSIELKIQIQNQCFHLSSLMKSSIIEIQKNNSLKLNITEMFYGPIGNLTLLNNKNIILKGPFQIKQDLLICNYQTSTLCIRQYNFEAKRRNIRFQVIVQENQIFEVIYEKQQNNYYVTWIKQQYYLCVSQLTDYLNIELIECSEKQDLTCKLISNLNVDLKIDQIKMADTMRVGNLIKLKGNNTQAFIVIDNINYNIQILPCTIIDILYIENSNDQYLILQKNVIDSNDFELTIYLINLKQKYQTYSLAITEKIYAELIKSGNFNKSTFTMKLVSCKQFGDQIIIKFLTLDQYFSQLFQLNLNTQKNQIQLELKNQFRNLINQNASQNENFNFQYMDDTLLILKSTEGVCSQFYEFHEDRKFNDYFHKSIFLMQIKRINTTHFIFIDNLQAQLGSIGYELQLQSCDEINQNFELFAQNEISNERVSLQIHIITTNQQFRNIILLIQITCFVFILIYTRKIKPCNQKQNIQ